MICGFLAAATVAVLSLTNDFVTLTFDADGTVSSLCERATGRELLKSRTPFVGLWTQKTPFAAARSCVRKGDRLVFALADGRTRLELRPEAFPGGWTFEAVASEAPAGSRWKCARLVPACADIVGSRANMLSDGKSAVCVRAYSLDDDMACGPGGLNVTLSSAPAVGSRFGLAAGPRSAIREMLQGMTIASGRAHSTGGGAWATDSETARLSYLNAQVRADKIDDWIDLMERGGFGILHFRESWFARRGHYPVNTNDWPRGLADLTEAVRKVHAAGYRAGMHTLTACIDPADPWVAGEENRYLRARASYALAAALTAEAAELTVTEAPKVTTDAIFSYSGNGNALRIGSEIIQFTGFTKTPPYRYTGLKRGAFGTAAAAHPKDARTDYLEQRYLAFYPDADSPLADKLADAIADVYRTCQFDQIYCDGTESGIGPGWQRQAAKMRDKIIRRCAAEGRPVINEDSCGCLPHVWWMHSRIGAWDNCWWAPKRFHDYHVDSVKRNHIKDGDLLEVQMGWWSPVTAQYYWPAQKLDEMEYYASRNVGLDATMSISGINVSVKPLSFHHARLMTVLGWYERARLARAFKPSLRAAMDQQGAEFRLRQDPADGAWRIAPVVCRADALTLAETPARSALRVEACYAGATGTAAHGLNMTTDFRAADLVVTSATARVALRVTDAEDGRGGKAFRLVATNATAASRGAWAVAAARYEPYRSLNENTVLRFRVKGDGSGALLNVQIKSPREYGDARNEHYVTLDFTGWRDFEMAMRETDAERFPDYVWPYANYATVYHTHIKFDKISDVSFYLNEIPAGGRTDITVSDVTMVREVKTTAVRPEIVVNGRASALPFDLESGQFAECEDGFWTLYTDNGAPLVRRPVSSPIAFVKGENRVLYRAKTATGEPCRAALRLFAIGRAREALVDVKDLAAADRRPLAYEAAMPVWFEPAKGFDGDLTVAVRPGERARVEFHVRGEIRGGTIAFGGQTHPISDQDVSGVARIVVKTPVSGVSCARVRAMAAACRVEVIKRYDR